MHMFHALLAGSPLPLAWMPSGFEWLVIAAFGLLIFGKRLPEVGRSLGKGIIEFKKGLKGVEDDIEEGSSKHSTTASSTSSSSQHKFDPYTGKPVQELPSSYKFDPHTGKPLDGSHDHPAEAHEVEAHV